MKNTKFPQVWSPIEKMIEIAVMNSDELNTDETVHAMQNAGVKVEEELTRLANPTIYFITAFTESHMEMNRAFRGDRPAHPETELDTETGLFRIVRKRDDGVKLHYHPLSGKGMWFRRQLEGKFTAQQAEKELEHIERLAGHPGYYTDHDSRTFGFYFDEETAIKAVEGNWMDMHEMKYTWIVIEPYGGHGIHPFGNLEEDKTIWYKWQDGDDESKIDRGGKWVKSDRPEETKNTICFAVG